MQSRRCSLAARASGTWVGIQNAVGNVSGIFGPAISGLIIDRMGYGSAFALASAISIFGGLWWAFGLPAHRRRSSWIDQRAGWLAAGTRVIIAPC